MIFFVTRTHMETRKKKKETRAKYELDLVFDGKNLTIKKSTIPGAGLGLFTCVSIPNNALITRFHGTVIDKSEADKLRQYDIKLIEKGDQPVYSTHFVNLSFAGGQILDGERDPTKLFGKGAASIANDPALMGDDEIEPNTKIEKTNSIISTKEIIWLKATQNIIVDAEHPEVELFTNYQGTSKGFEQQEIQPLRKGALLTTNTNEEYEYMPPIYTVDEECLSMFLHSRMKIAERSTWRDSVRIKKIPTTFANKYFPEVKVGRALVAAEDIRKRQVVVEMPKTKELVKNSKEEKEIIDGIFNDRPEEQRPYGDISVRVSHDAIFIDSEIDIVNLQVSDSYWYAMNHSSSEPNVKLKYDSKNENVYWVALRDIDRGEEITWDYGNVPSDWQ